MTIRKLSEELSVSPQIRLSDLAVIRAAGFRSILCNRPDAEDAGQPSFAETQSAAREHGLEMRHQPIVPGRISGSDVAAFKALVRDLPKPILAYCRTGARSSSLWAMTLPK